ncbi:N-acetylmuramoyl-L-alanine amidase [Gracilibacillus dipsosauri]|uniref:N-acetylmuramoyl-L-alanine amidase n=1 Tax=Gracilibacillus dipsosauri TaxID=178340 RepID=A0A317KV85_9BACI|nr:N-acetylmuramoyl-L-alanine amidase [Gracilibacillus dipsosauri]PWU67335.1 N-acetylmuramoyl-L-alanine amidase [Gracilibacillus dipsosauri]
MRKRSIFITTTIIFLLLILFPTMISANEKTYDVGTTNLLIRSGPSIESEVLGKLNPGDQVKVFDESNGWYQTYYNGKEAWVASQFLFQGKQKSVTSPSSESVSISATGVRIRSGPGTSYSIIGFTTLGETFSVLDKNNDWIKVSLPNGNIGWIASWLTNQQASEAIPKARSNKSIQEPSKSISGNASLSGYNIILDPGHGGNDSGAIGVGNVYEKDMVMEVVDDITNRLKQEGATVLLTRSNDTRIELPKRVAISHAYQTHAFISLHFNASPIISANGISTHYYSNQNLAYQVQNAIAQHLNLSDRGIRQDSFYVLRNNQNPAILIEMGFITNPSDLLKIQSKDYQSSIAEAITQGLISYFKN